MSSRLEAHEVHLRCAVRWLIKVEWEGFFLAIAIKVMLSHSRANSMSWKAEASRSIQPSLSLHREQMENTLVI